MNNKSKASSASRRRPRKSSLAAMIALALIAVAVVVSACTNNPASRYEEASALLNKGEYAQAAAAFEALGDYEDSAEMVKACHIAEAEANYLSGFERIELGSYEQDGSADNGSEAIEWIVLAEKDGRKLVTSLYALDSRAFHDSLEVKIAWSNSSLRAWLNDGFLNEAFSSEEQAKIVPAVLVNNGGSEDKAASDEETEDMIFILSADELEKYFPNEGDRASMATDFTEAAGARVSKNNGCTYWWLRAPRETGNHQPMVNNRGEVITKDANGEGAVRPAMWIISE